MTNAGGHFLHQWDQQYKCWMEQVLCPPIFPSVVMHVSLLFWKQRLGSKLLNYRYIAAKRCSFWNYGKSDFPV